MDMEEDVSDMEVKDSDMQVDDLDEIINYIDTVALEREMQRDNFFHHFPPMENDDGMHMQADEEYLDHIDTVHLQHAMGRDSFFNYFPPLDNLFTKYTDIKVEVGNGKLKGLQMSSSTDSYTAYSLKSQNTYLGSFKAYWFEFDAKSAAGSSWHYTFDNSQEDDDSNTLLDLVAIVDKDKHAQVRLTRPATSGSFNIHKIILDYDPVNRLQAHVKLSFKGPINPPQTAGTFPDVRVPVNSNLCLEEIHRWLNEMIKKYRLDVVIESRNKSLALNHKDWKDLLGPKLPTMSHLRRREEQGRGSRP
jgi:hypothetical protein